MARTKDTTKARLDTSDKEDVNNTLRRTSRSRRQSKRVVEMQPSSSSSPEPESESRHEAPADDQIGDEDQDEDTDDDDDVPDEADDAAVESSSLSPPPPEPEAIKRKGGRPRKSDVSTPHRPSITGPRPSLDPTQTRGGNKRKATHEYCLTCSRYGRACGGRREGDEGCAVCREPNKEKGEKLRECHWADPANGIETYDQARAKEKIAQAAERAAVGKPPTKRQLEYLTPAQANAYKYAPTRNYRPPPDYHQTSDYHPTPDRHHAPEPLGLAEPGPRVAGFEPPPVSRTLNVRPPPSTSGPRQIPDGTAEPRVHNPRVIKLFVKNEQQAPPSQSPYDPPRMQPTTPDPITGQIKDANGHRVPHYSAEINAYILPAYPHSNLLPPHMIGKVANMGWISPYDAWPFIPIAIDENNPPRPVIYQPGLPPPDTNVNVPRPAYSKPRPLDKTGKPVKKWSRSNSSVQNVGGYPLETSGWKSTAEGKKKEEADSEPLEVTSNAVSANAEARAYLSDASSELSSVIDMDDDAIEVVDLEHSRPNTANEARKESPAPEQARFNNMFGGGSKRKHSSLSIVSSAAASPDLLGARPTKESKDAVLDEDETEDEGPLKTVPLQQRKGSTSSALSAVSNSSSTIEVATMKPASTTKKQMTVTEARITSRSHEGQLRTAQEAPVASTSSSWKAVNGTPRISLVNGAITTSNSRASPKLKFTTSKKFAGRVPVTAARRLSEDTSIQDA